MFVPDIEDGSNVIKPSKDKEIVVKPEDPFKGMNIKVILPLRKLR